MCVGVKNSVCAFARIVVIVVEHKLCLCIHLLEGEEEEEICSMLNSCNQQLLTIMFARIVVIHSCCL